MKETGETLPSPTASSGVVVARALICVGTFYGVMVFLNGVAMQESASLLEFGRQRSAVCVVNRPLEIVSRVTGACHVRQSLRDSVGRWLNNPE